MSDDWCRRFRERWYSQRSHTLTPPINSDRRDFRRGGVLTGQAYSPFCLSKEAVASVLHIRDEVWTVALLLPLHACMWTMPERVALDAARCSTDTICVPNKPGVAAAGRHVGAP